MVSSSQIRDQLSQFLDGRISLNDFEDWFVSNTWNIHLSHSVAAEHLTFEIEGVLSEFSSSHHNQNVLRRELAKIQTAETQVVCFAEVHSDEILFKASAPALWFPVSA